MKQGSLAIVALVVAIGLFDATTGAFLLLSAEPWWAHGRGTVWLDAPKLINAHSEAAPVLLSLFRRTGAFSLHIGVLTMALGILGRRDRRILSFILAIYTIDGIAFFFTDHAYFSGTPYMTLKQVVGTAWALALVWHIYEGRRSNASDPARVQS
jgi:hypothetical protein